MLWTALAESKQQGCCAPRWLLHSGCCAATNVRGGGLLRLGGGAPTLLALCPLLHCFRRFGGDAHPQVLLRPVSLPVHNDEIACHIIVQAETI